MAQDSKSGKRRLNLHDVSVFLTPQSEHMIRRPATCSQKCPTCAANLTSATWKTVWQHAIHCLVCSERSAGFLFPLFTAWCVSCTSVQLWWTLAAQSTAALTSNCRQPRLMRWVAIRPVYLTLGILTCRRPCISNFICLSILRNDTQPHIRRAGGIWRQL